ncbi:DUF1616 domain-containing protein [Halobacteria archaeon AArc-m2/3/4]|uniref:DUF1616 domain-containing protein n=1 Tax=Natronoglomus mannanivorans TaxID=2979990 RepID=A0ABT2QKA9_9EURY|nr:DUF1616 domain-containing protein [Halobacteria archaeon AArc-m2/3/4]
MTVDVPSFLKPARSTQLIPVDLAIVVGLLLIVNISVFAPVIRETPLRVPFVFVMALFVPGYAVVSALYPEAGTSPAGDVNDAKRESFLEARFRPELSGTERVALSFGLSIVIVPMIGFPLTIAMNGVSPTWILLAVTLFSLLATSIAVVRRWNVPEEERFIVPYREWIATAKTGINHRDARADVTLSILLIASIILMIGTIGYAGMMLPQQDQFSSITIDFEEDETTVGEGILNETSSGPNGTFVVDIDNHEYRSIEYTLIVQQTHSPPDNESGENEPRELDQFEFTVDHDETERLEYEIDPAYTGDGARITFLLYPGENPDEPDVENAPYHAYVTFGDE